jgi:8-amino-7-oxononanoate synthase
VYGEAGRGFAAEAGVNDSIDVTVVTLSKALGVQGGAVCGSERFCDAVVNFGRAYIYSTSVSPAIAAAASAAVGVLRAEPQRRERVREMALRVRREAKRIGLSLPEGDSPIVPVIVGSEARAMEAANLLCERGILTIAVRPPTVPRGQSRLRITVSSEHTAAEIDQLIEALGAIV